MSLIGSYNDYKYYKVPVKGTMTDNNILNSCNLVGMKPPCVNEQNGVYSDDKCRDVGFKDGQIPLKELANEFCVSTKRVNNQQVKLNPSECNKINDSYAYMGNKRPNGGSCGLIFDGCLDGTTDSNRTAICVKKDSDNPVINNLKWIGTSQSDPENPTNNQVFIYQLNNYMGWRISLNEGSFRYPYDEFVQVQFNFYDNQYFQLLDNSNWMFPMGSIKVGSNMFVLFSETDDITGDNADSSYQPGFSGPLELVVPKYIITKSVIPQCNSVECCKRINNAKKREKTTNFKYESTKFYYQCAGCPIVNAPDIIPNCELKFFCDEEPCASCCSEARCKPIIDKKNDMLQQIQFQTDRKIKLMNEIEQIKASSESQRMETQKQISLINMEIKKRADEHRELIDRKLKEKNEIIDKVALEIKSMSDDYKKYKDFTNRYLEYVKNRSIENNDEKYLNIEIDLYQKIKDIGIANDNLVSYEQNKTNNIIAESESDLINQKIVLQNIMTKNIKDIKKGFFTMTTNLSKDKKRLAQEHTQAINKLTTESQEKLKILDSQINKENENFILYKSQTQDQITKIKNSLTESIKTNQEVVNNLTKLIDEKSKYNNNELIKITENYLNKINNVDQSTVKNQKEIIKNNRLQIEQKVQETINKKNSILNEYNRIKTELANKNIIFEEAFQESIKAKSNKLHIEENTRINILLESIIDKNAEFKDVMVKFNRDKKDFLDKKIEQSIKLENNEKDFKNQIIEFNTYLENQFNLKIKNLDIEFNSEINKLNESLNQAKNNSNQEEDKINQQFKQIKKEYEQTKQKMIENQNKILDDEINKLKNIYIEKRTKLEKDLLESNNKRLEQTTQLEVNKKQLNDLSYKIKNYQMVKDNANLTLWILVGLVIANLIAIVFAIKK